MAIIKKKIAETKLRVNTTTARLVFLAKTESYSGDAQHN